MPSARVELTISSLLVRCLTNLAIKAFSEGRKFKLNCMQNFSVGTSLQCTFKLLFKYIHSKTYILEPMIGDFPTTQILYIILSKYMYYYYKIKLILQILLEVGSSEATNIGICKFYP